MSDMDGVVWGIVDVADCFEVSDVVVEDLDEESVDRGDAPEVSGCVVVIYSEEEIVNGVVIPEVIVASEYNCVDGVGTVVVAVKVSGKTEEDSKTECILSVIASELSGIDAVGMVIVSVDVPAEIDGDSEWDDADDSEGDDECSVIASELRDIDADGMVAVPVDV